MVFHANSPLSTLRVTNESRGRRVGWLTSNHSGRNRNIGVTPMCPHCRSPGTLCDLLSTDSGSLFCHNCHQFNRLRLWFRISFRVDVLLWLALLFFFSSLILLSFQSMAKGKLHLNKIVDLQQELWAWTVKYSWNLFYYPG